MKVCLFWSHLIFLFFGCQSLPKHDYPTMDLSPISVELKGNTLGNLVTTRLKRINQPHFESLLFYKTQKEKTTEIDIYLFPNNLPGYDQLLEFYNTQFKTAKTDTIFNTWETDSTEFILFRNSDSSILVNINQRTH